MLHGGRGVRKVQKSVTYYLNGPLPISVGHDEEPLGFKAYQSSNLGLEGKKLNCSFLCFT